MHQSFVTTPPALGLANVLCFYFCIVPAVLGKWVFEIPKQTWHTGGGGTLQTAGENCCLFTSLLSPGRVIACNCWTKSQKSLLFLGLGGHG